MVQKQSAGLITCQSHDEIALKMTCDQGRHFVYSLSEKVKPEVARVQWLSEAQNFTYAASSSS